MFAQKSGAMLGDFLGFWALGLDMLPSKDSTLKLCIKTGSDANTGQQVCNRDTGLYVADNCTMKAKVETILGILTIFYQFYGLGSGQPKDQPQPKENNQEVEKMQKKWKHKMMNGSNLVIKGRPIDADKYYFMEILFLYGWDTQDDISK